MKYLIVLYATYNTEASPKKALYEAETEDAAVASFHGYMSTYMKDTTVKHVLVHVVDESGNVIRSESFDR